MIRWATAPGELKYTRIYSDHGMFIEIDSRYRRDKHPKVTEENEKDAGTKTGLDASFVPKPRKRRLNRASF